MLRSLLSALFAFCLLLAAGCSPAASQPEPTPLSGEQVSVSTLPVDWQKTPRFENTSIEQGLSQSVALAILQDKTGFVWIATQDGLNRFDGNEFVIYKNDPDNPNSLGNNFTRLLTGFKELQARRRANGAKLCHIA